ncbi:sperm acrosome-associated protein 7 isoform X1 [Ailuropoda melanoleuca]|uniref:Sperm acrosome-associated protein 7 n=1 Tax=Ailuropoda melanoleuca TaxID=9646 RepID=A0A7N5KN21_AILME|nr:sperm acrosome-associated protein 7 isoform X1 [Ailuropoda melanoleuca]
MTSQVPGHSAVSWRPRQAKLRALGEGLPPSAGENMAGNRGVTLFVLLLSCWREAKLHPVKIFSGPSTAIPSNLRILDDDVAGVFDEILVQEMLDPNKSSIAGKQRTASTLSTKLFTEKNAHTKRSHKMGINKKDHKKEVSSGDEDRLSLNEETMYQIKNLAALEKIIYSLQRALGKTLKQKIRKHKHSIRVAKLRKRKWTLN